MFGEMWYTSVHIDGIYVGKFVGWGKDYDGGRNFTIVLYVTDEGNLHGKDFARNISFPDLAKETYLHG